MGSLNLAQETIAFQKDDVGKQIEAVITEIFAKIRKNDAYRAKDTARLCADELKKLSDITLNRFGLKTNFIPYDSGWGAMITFPVNKYSILIKKVYRGYKFTEHDKVLKELNGQEGTVDLKNAKLTGMFSVYQHSLYLNFGMFVDIGLTPAELTAVTLHEIGHAFTFYEFADRVESTNQVLREIAASMKGKNDKNRKLYLFTELGKATSGNKDEFVDMVDKLHNPIFGVELFKRVIKAVGSQLPNNKYDETTSEQLADNFATKFGYGRELVSVLSKTGSTSPYGLDEATAISIWIMFFQIAVMIMGLFFIGFPMSISLLFVLVVGIITGTAFGFNVYQLGSGKMDMTYDTIRTRYKRIRDQIIEHLKDVTLNKEDMANLVDQISMIDNIMNDVKDEKGAFTVISDFIFSKNKAASDSIALQKLLEDLAHNDMFLASAKLKTLA